MMVSTSSISVASAATPLSVPPTRSMTEAASKSPSSIQRAAGMPRASPHETTWSSSAITWSR